MPRLAMQPRIYDFLLRRANIYGTCAILRAVRWKSLGD